ncbi:hypothetical protein ES702_04117 [subsurface metagenome]
MTNRVNSEEFKEMWTKSIPRKDIASHFGITLEYVPRIAKKLNLLRKVIRKKAKEINLEELKKMYLQGTPCTDLAIHFGTYANHIYCLIRELNLPKNLSYLKKRGRKERIEIDLDEFKKMYLQGITIMKLAIHFGTHSNHIYCTARGLGLSRRKRRKPEMKTSELIVSLKEVKEPCYICEKDISSKELELPHNLIKRKGNIKFHLSCWKKACYEIVVM